MAAAFAFPSIPAVLRVLSPPRLWQVLYTGFLASYIQVMAAAKRAFILSGSDDDTFFHRLLMHHLPCKS